MNDNSRETVFERTYKQLDQQILEHAKTEIFSILDFIAKLEHLSLKQEKIAKILKKQEQEEANFAEEKRQAIFGDDPVYQKAKEA